jgi:hypothetical protein
MTDERRVRDRQVSRRRTNGFLRVVSPWTIILIITGCFHLYRGAIADGVIFLAVAVALIADAVGVLRFGRARSPGRPPRVVLTVAAAVVGVPLLLAPLFGIVDLFVLLAVGVATLVIAWPDSSLAPGDSDAARAPARRRAAVLWAWVALAFCIWELAAYLLGRPSAAAEYAFPPLSDLLDPAVTSPFWRIILVAGWLAGGAALLRRGRHP